MANSVQLFLGTRIQCAQCHDHPPTSGRRPTSACRGRKITRADHARCREDDAGQQITTLNNSIPIPQAANRIMRLISVGFGGGDKDTLKVQMPLRP